jgi:hypothetical protein
MFAISKPKLSIGEISHYWSQEITESSDEILAFLEQAWWRGEIRTESGSRLNVLKGIFDWWCKYGSASIAFVTPEDAAQPEPPPDESVLVNMRPTILIPSTYPDEWSDDSCANAFQLLADAPSLTYYPERSPGFMALKLTYNQFVRLLTNHHRALPDFWRPPVECQTQVSQEPRASPSEQAGLKELAPIASQPRKRGPPALKLESVKHAMRSAVQKGQQTPDGLRDMHQKELAHRYNVGRTTANAARNAVLLELATTKPRQTTTNDK